MKVNNNYKICHKYCMAFGKGLLSIIAMHLIFLLVCRPRLFLVVIDRFYFLAMDDNIVVTYSPQGNTKTLCESIQLIYI